jgi:hypothetical protein
MADVISMALMAAVIGMVYQHDLADVDRKTPPTGRQPRLQRSHISRRSMDGTGEYLINKTARRA